MSVDQRTVLDELVGLARHYEEQASAAELGSTGRFYLAGKAWAFRHAADLLREGKP